MARSTKSSDELRAATDHLYYEIEMLRGTMREIMSGDAPGLSVQYNALLESFTIHARALIHFLRPQNPHPTDVLAEDFFTGSRTWHHRPTSEPASFAAARGRVNKEVAHLTYDRQNVTPEAKGWDIYEIAHDILQELETFAKDMDHMLLGKRWRTPEGNTNLALIITPLPRKVRYITDPSTPSNI